MRIRRAALLATLAGFGGCAIGVPTIDYTGLACSPTDPCGNGWTCVANACQPVGSGATSGAGPSSSGTSTGGGSSSGSTGRASSGGTGSASSSAGTTGTHGSSGSGAAASGSSTGSSTTGSSSGSTGTGSGSSGSGGSTSGGFSTLSVVAGTPGGAGDLDGVGSAARFSRPQALAWDGAGDLYVADFDNETIRQIDVATASVTTLAGSPGFGGSSDGVGTTAQFYRPEGLTCDGAGTLYVADTFNDLIRTVAVSTEVVTTLAGSPGNSGSADGPLATALFSSPHALAWDGIADLFVADTANEVIRTIDLDAGEVTTLAGSPGDAGSADGTGAAARFDGLHALAWDGDGGLFVADTNSDTIRYVETESGAVSTLAGSPGAAGSADGTGAGALFSGPRGIAFDGTNDVFVADTGNDTLRVLEVQGGTVTTLAGSATLAGSSDGTGAIARFSQPAGLAWDGHGHVFVADSDNATIREVTFPGGSVSTLAGAAPHAGSVDGLGASAQLMSPQGICSDGAGALFVADTGNDTIRRIALATGVMTTVAGSPGFAGRADGVGTNAHFNAPTGLACDGMGDVFVADTGNDTIRQIVIDGGLVTTLTGSPGVSGSADGVGGDAGFSGPEGVAWGGNGTLFVADTGNDTIREVAVATATVTTLAGTVGLEGRADGTGTAAHFSSPVGLAWDGAGNLYVADSANSTVRQMTLSGLVVTTYAGTAGQAGDADGFGMNARFDTPGGLAIDGAGNLFVTDTGNGTVRQVALATALVTTLAGVGRQQGVVPGPLPARVNTPSGIADVPGVGLFVTDSAENVVLEIH